MTDASPIQFDDPPRGGSSSAEPATERIAATLREAGIDAPNSLYDEALSFARDGHLGQAHARLQMLLCLDPDDADALLLLAKIHAAQNRPAEALGRLDASVAAGAFPPAGFREHLEAAIRAERAREEEHRARIAAREQGEIRTLRHETRTLRSDNVRLETEVTDARIRERNWKYAALGTSVAATLILAVLSLFGGRHAASIDAPASAPVADAVVVPAGATDAGAHVAGSAQGSAPIVGTITPPVAAVVASSAVVANSVVPAVPSAVVPSAPKGTADKAAADKAAPKGTADKAAADKAAGPHEHVVVQGDTLYKLAKQYYGDSEQWERIQKANKSVLKHGKDLDIGMKLHIP